MWSHGRHQGGVQGSAKSRSACGVGTGNLLGAGAGKLCHSGAANRGAWHSRGNRVPRQLRTAQCRGSQRGIHHAQAGVTRASCAGGVTGKVLEPVVETAAERITITTNVEPLPLGGYTCQSNDIVPIAVQLAEPGGNRELFDAICLDSFRLTTADCLDEGIRWRP